VIVDCHSHLLMSWQLTVRRAKNDVVEVGGSGSAAWDIVAIDILADNTIEKTSMPIKASNNSVPGGGSGIRPFPDNDALVSIRIGKRCLSGSCTTIRAGSSHATGSGTSVDAATATRSNW
jgi:hypothetical protein